MGLLPRVLLVSPLSREIERLRSRTDKRSLVMPLRGFVIGVVSVEQTVDAGTLRSLAQSTAPSVSRPLCEVS